VHKATGIFLHLGRRWRCVYPVGDSYFYLPDSHRISFGRETLRRNEFEGESFEFLSARVDLLDEAGLEVTRENLRRVAVVTF